MSKSVTNNNPPRLITVDFHGDPVTCIQGANVTGVAMRPMSEKLGLDWPDQWRSIQKDPVLKQVIVKLTTTSTGTDGKTYPVEMITLPLDYLNGWLFKIDAGRYKEHDPRREVIIRYQRECYRVLHDYWHKGEATFNPQLPSRTGTGTPIVPLGQPELYVPTELLTDKILEWVLAQTDPFDEADVLRGTGCSIGYARECLKKFARKGLVVRGRDRYWRLTAKALVMIGKRERPQYVQVMNEYIAKVDMRPGVPLDVQVQLIELHDRALKQVAAQEKQLPPSLPDGVRLPLFMREARELQATAEAPTVALAPCARAVDLGWKESSSGPHVEKLQRLHTRLVGKVLYFFPLQWMSEALDMPIDTIKGMLDPEKFEIFTDNGEVRQWLSTEVNAYHASFEQDTFVTTFGLQRLMQLKEQKAKRAPNLAAVKVVFSSLMELANMSGIDDWKEAAAKANAATLKLTGVDCLKLLEG